MSHTLGVGVGADGADALHVLCGTFDDVGREHVLDVLKLLGVQEQRRMVQQRQYLTLPESKKKKKNK